MGHDPVDVDALCSRAGLSAEQVSSQLLRLELDGRVTALPGGLYQRLEKGDSR
jgi:DNA processing protein